MSASAGGAATLLLLLSIAIPRTAFGLSGVPQYRCFPVVPVGPILHDDAM